ncbi:MAG TPA: tRNA (uridine(34)/cytosine(34)/5-carboxymethylaminomethyluridine(34)-2'-O)-methyltransferase TrmL, partial [Gammaproteobacteria bacterium]|nr:tRNA (uridine(34)/cytosine(34)/5-carboxymethylaminomethyluridine(34)-2'-O)-methyltransferase TrmL [Gammaproteobacteria bacterium]
FGPDAAGLPQTILTSSTIEQVIRIPMQANNRSINLANSVAIICYEAWRQFDFIGGH